jgi:hypothetical protein
LEAGTLGTWGKKANEINADSVSAESQRAGLGKFTKLLESLVDQCFAERKAD